jgi:hypothetical protein
MSDLFSKVRQIGDQPKPPEDKAKGAATV